MNCECGKPVRANNMCASCNGKEYYRKNKAEIQARKRKYYKDNRDKEIAKAKKWNKENPDRVAMHHSKWSRESKYYKNRYNSDSDYRLKVIVRNRLNDAIKHGFKSGKTLDLLGCSIGEFRQHIESLWQPGMTWDNHSLSGWHIDHVRPLNSFDLSNPEELKKACHYSNMQPLWASDNIKKCDRV